VKVLNKVTQNIEGECPEQSKEKTLMENNLNKARQKMEIRATPLRRPRLSARICLGRNEQKSRPNAATQMDESPLFVPAWPISGPNLGCVCVIGVDTKRTRATPAHVLPLARQSMAHPPYFPSFPRKPPARPLSRPLAMDEAPILDAAVGLASSVDKLCVTMHW
jgi:hypothetical protein